MSVERTRVIDPAGHRRHPLHTSDRVWVETNCYVDVWIELLAHLDLPPEPAGVTALSSTAVGRQWSFLKFQTDDLRRLYGIEVGELNAWRSTPEHIVEHLRADEFLTVESDSWFLPDTDGTAYRTEHVKTTIIPLQIDVEDQRLVYLHNAGQFELGADDFAGALGLPGSGSTVPLPYLELIRLTDHRPTTGELAAATLELARDHLRRAPVDNPVERLMASLESESDRLASEGMPYFHLVSFATTRQLGLCAQAASDGLRWLAEHGLSAPGIDPSARAQAIAAAEAFDEVSAGAKRLQFALARIAAGRGRGLKGAQELSREWATGMAAVRSALR